MKPISKNKKIDKIFNGSVKEMKLILPIFFIAILISVLIDTFIPDEVIMSLLNQHLFIAIPIAAIIGVILPLPKYSTYPIAYTLLTKGAGYGVVLALISGEVIAVIRDYVEIEYFGAKFFGLRMALSTVLIIMGAFLIEVFL